MKVREIYTQGVLSADPAEDLALAASRMDFQGVGALLVRDASGVCGILTERDLLHAVAEDRRLEGVMVSEYMTEDPISIDIDAGIGDAATTMLVLGTRHLPVTERGQTVGMISARDLLGVEAFAELAASLEHSR